MGDAMIGSAILVHGPSGEPAPHACHTCWLYPIVEPGVGGGPATPPHHALVLPLWFAPM